MSSAAKITVCVIVALTICLVSFPLMASEPDLVVQYKCGQADPLDSQVSPHFKIVNNTGDEIPLSECTIRYWYTVDGERPQNFWCDWAWVGSANVRGEFHGLDHAVEGADCYLEVSFDLGAGTIAPGGDSGDVQCRFAKSDWTGYCEDDDYSFDASKACYTSWDRVTLYRNGDLVWGREPGDGEIPNPQPEPEPEPEPQPDPQGCIASISFVKTSDWGGGFCADVTITNIATETIDGWTLDFEHAVDISNLWSGTRSGVKPSYTVTNASWNGAVDPGAGVQFGYQGSYSGDFPQPTGFTLNGRPCLVDGEEPAPQPEPDPEPNPQPEPEPEPEPQPDPQGCIASISFVKTSDWGGGFCADVTITNIATETIDGWTLDFEHAVDISNLWSGTRSGVKPSYTVTNASWNGAVDPGAGVQFGYQGSYSGDFPQPTGFTLNGRPCLVDGEEPAPQPEPDPEPQPEPEPEPNPVPIPDGTRVIGYFTAWGVYGRDFHVSDIPAELLTHINYAFANISEEGECVLGDPYADIDKYYTGDSWDEGSLRGNFHQLQLLKERYPHIRTLISVGGWTWSGRFSDVALTAESRQRFASSCVEFITEYGFDGVDIDWEYPVGGGLAGNAARPEDKVNYTLLLKELRAQLDARGDVDGRHYLLTIAAPAGEGHFNNIELEKIHSYLDWINLMTYDFHGGWDSMTNFNSPLYPHPEDPSSEYVKTVFNVDYAVHGYLAAGVPAGKLVMGVPFYGRGWSGVPDVNGGLFQQAGGVPQGTWESGMFDYVDLEANYIGKGYTRYWSEDSKVPWLYNPATGIMISYDDPESLGLKAEYVRNNQLGGVMIWELSSDDTGGNLLDSLVRHLAH
ncbi:MAG: glycosyl hydrolase family 18 protein [Actinomycetota bacterium]|nr:glycosyl hydrolase family 18 protein [Actinomycetota bacterium]